MLLQSCRMRAPDRKKHSPWWDIQPALFQLLLPGTHRVLVNHSNQARSRNVPSKQMAAAAGSQETTGFGFFSPWCVGVDSVSRQKSKWLSFLSFFSKGDMSVFIYLWDRLPFTRESLPLTSNCWTLCNTCRFLLSQAVVQWPLHAFSYSWPLR